MIKGPAEWYDGSPRGRQGGFGRNRFTERECELIRRMWAALIPPAIIAEKIGREDCVVRAKARALGLVGRKDIRREEYCEMADRIIEECDERV